MVEALQVLVGAALSILLDWAIYTHLSEYLRLGFPATPDASYREVALGSSTAIIRTVALAVTGVTGGLAFALGLAPLWLLAVGLFAVAHAVLYALLYRRGERS